MNHILGLSLTQPWATLVSIGSKKIETRSWSTPYRGWLAIHAAKGLSSIGGKSGLWEQCEGPAFQRGLRGWLPTTLPLGAIVAVARLTNCVSTGNGTESLFSSQMPEPKSDEYAFGDYSPGRYMWMLSDVIALPEPIPWKGALNLWKLPDGLEGQLIRLAQPSGRE